MNFFQNLFQKKASSLTSDGREPPEREFMRVSGTDWATYAAEISSQGMSGENRQPQVCLYLNSSSSAEMLGMYRPEECDRFLDEPPRVVAFPDSTGAVHFSLKNGEGIRDILSLLLGQSYPDTLVVTNGVCIGAPQADKSSILGFFGVAQGMDFAGALIW